MQRTWSPNPRFSFLDAADETSVQKAKKHLESLSTVPALFPKSRRTYFAGLPISLAKHSNQCTAKSHWREKQVAKICCENLLPKIYGQLLIGNSICILMRDEKVTINAPVNGDIRRTPIDVNANSAERGEIENFLPDKINREWAAIIKSSPSHFQPIGRKGRLDGSKSIKRDLFLARSSDTDIPDSHENLSFSDSSSGVPEMWFRAGPPLGSGGRFDGDGAIFSEGKGDDIFSGPEVNHILRRRRRSSRLRKKEVTLSIMMPM